MPYRIAQFALGVLCFTAIRGGFSISVNRYVSALAIIPILLAVATVDHSFSWHVHYLGFSLLATACLWVIVGTREANLLSTAPFQFVGRISYSLYLVHWPIAVVIRLHYGETPASILAIIAISIILGYIVYKLVESRVYYSKHGGVTLFGSKLVRKQRTNDRHPRIKVWVIPLLVLLPSATAMPLARQAFDFEVAKQPLDMSKALFDEFSENHLVPRNAQREIPAQGAIEGGQIAQGPLAPVVSYDEPVVPNVIEVMSLKQEVQSFDFRSRTIQAAALSKHYRCNLPASASREPERYEALLADPGDCLEGNVLILADSTGSLAAPFIAAIYGYNSSLAVLSGGGCGLQIPPRSAESQCSRLNEIRDEILRGTRGSYDAIYIAFNLLADRYDTNRINQQIDYIGSLGVQVNIMTPQPMFDLLPEQILRVNQGARDDLSQYVVGDWAVKRAVIIEAAARWDNVDIFEWSALDDGSSIPAIDEFGAEIYRDGYHTTKEGNSYILRNFLAKNCGYLERNEVCNQR